MADGPDPVDVIVGSNIRAARRARNVSQSKLAEYLDVTFQQIQKYENGKNRVSASKLHRISVVLNVQVQSLFDGTHRSDALSEPADVYSKEAHDVARAFDRIRDNSVKIAVRRLLLTLGLGEPNHD